MPEGVLQSPLLASFRDCYRDLLRYLAHRTGSADEARDLAHDTWLRLADMAQQGSQPALQDSGEARAYVFSMARNLVVDRQRRMGVVQRHADAQAGQQPQAPDTAEALMYRQAMDAVQAALAGLPERARQVFVRHRVHGEDQAALAACYGVSRNMIERDMMQAMDCVQAAMERWHAGSVAAPAQSPRVGRRKSLVALLGIAGLGSLGAWQAWRSYMPQWQRQLATGHGQILRRSLPDGSGLTLDAQSRLQLAYFAGRRSVALLQGAAFFDVVRDAARPFVVDVPGAAAADGSLRITVLGTRFGVERLLGGGVDVQVEEGRVRIERLDGQALVLSQRELVAGEAWRMSAGGEERLTRQPQPVAPWRNGMLVFADTPLAGAVERLRRYLPRPVLVDASVAGLRLSGQVRIAQGEDFLRALPDILPVRSALVGGRWEIAPLRKL
nr:sigma-70 family RNA polymerase sigma factor [uncultured Albidiferax sp.]